MLDVRWVSDHLEEVKTGLAKRGFTDASVLDKVASLSSRRREVITELETLRSKRNEVSKSLASLDKSGEEFQKARQEVSAMKARLKELEEAQREVESTLEEAALYLPNLPHESTPEGLDEASNKELRKGGAKPSFDFEPKDHVDLGEALDILDITRGAKISGSRFVVLKGMGARLERALMMFMLDVHATEHGYEEIWPPAIVKASAMRGTSQLPKFAKDAFRLAKDEEWAENNSAADDLYLVPTAEVPVTNLHADEIFEASQLPVAYTAYSPCFRSEAGSYGRDTRGMIRVHQFDKVELVRFCKPEDGEAELDKLTGHAEAILDKLGLHYRVVQLCGGDMGFAAKKGFDIEVWLPGQSAYREISSCSWFGDFQARRAKIRYRPEPKAKPRLANTLNGSGLAIGRTLVAILEQYQNADGSVNVPSVLVPYMRGVEVLKP